MMQIDYSVLFLVSSVTIVIGLVLHHRMQAGPERAFLWAFLCGTFVICGFGTAYVVVPHALVVQYLVYVLAAGICFTIFVGVLRSVGTRMCRKIDWRLTRSDATQIAMIGFWVYLASVTFPLIYPTIRLNLLWNPPVPDLLGAFNFGVTEKEPALRIIGYITLLSYPFYLWRLQIYATRIVRLALAIFGPLYFAYCADGYIGRGSMLMGIVLYAALLWSYHRRARRYIVISLLTLTPLALIGSAEYATVRVGISLSGGNLLDDVSRLIEVETGLPLNAAVVFESGKQVDLKDLALWAVTLPLPKVLTGNILTFQPNADMAEIITEIPLGEQGFSFELPGIVGESVYFGRRFFFWLPAVITGAMFGLLCAFFSKSEQLGGVTVYCVLLWGYIFTRAGMNAGLPLVINGLLPFLCFVALLSAGTRLKAQLPDLQAL